MATNVSVYVPNVGEKEMLKALLLQKAMILGLYANQIIPDGNTIFDTLTELATGGGRGYARKELTNNVIETALAADKWFVSTNSTGKAEGAYSNAVQTWTFTAVEVADAPTVYGVMAFSWVLPFDAGSEEIKVGDTILATSGASGIVTGVCVQSGTWAVGTAAGYLDIKTKTGTFVDGEDIWVKGRIATLTAAPTAAGDTYSVGDLFEITTDGEGACGVVLTLTGGDNTPVATIGTAPGMGGRNYTVGTGKVTAKLSGGGNDALTVAVASLSTVVCAVTNTGVTGDAHKRLLGVWAFAAGVAITATGQQITWDHRVALASGT